MLWNVACKEFAENKDHAREGNHADSDIDVDEIFEFVLVLIDVVVDDLGKTCKLVTNGDGRNQKQ